MPKPNGETGPDATAAKVAMPNSWPEGGARVEMGVMSVGYYFSNASSLVMRVRQVVVAAAPVFFKLGWCVRTGRGQEIGV